ncbi:hypothetical protein BBP40_006691 [Aspergillus hancockii]|nr:hypothetical protein BBP40_006691 [Aspergillus hancockii]
MQPTVPLWVSITLLILTFVSFVPQLRRVHQRKNSSGISLRYLLCNLISATEQLGLGLFCVVVQGERLEFFIHNPRDAGDWVNLAQFTVVWVLAYAIPIRRTRKISGMAMYFFLLLGILYPLVTEPIPDVVCPGENCAYRGWVVGPLVGQHMIYIHPIVTGVSIVGLLKQAQEIKRHPISALSLAGLVGQALTFTLVALSWVFRIRFPYERIDQITPSVLFHWYQAVGWAAVDNAVFAFMQFILLWLSLRHRSIPETPVDKTQSVIEEKR